MPEQKQILTESILQWVNESFFTFEFVPGATAGGATQSAIENYLVDIFTKLIISLCTAWWSIREIVDYFQNRKFLKEIIPDGQPNLS